ncbi:MAG: hypothetical protein AUI33_13535 [Ignavibacteria bacterium 13_1_40CM_2_61_4]|nr:MAG: hypothetical protein AUI33_13535 [Ignavibacteria bacterium 13_1_40CM_2_61_4]
MPELRHSEAIHRQTLVDESLFQPRRQRDLGDNRDIEVEVLTELLPDSQVDSLPVDVAESRRRQDQQIHAPSLMLSKLKAKDVGKQVVVHVDGRCRYWSAMPGNDELLDTTVDH